mmetsp:Transcript_6700/g.17260  ORF Transcript_6700/g.17260 Transcript_6700/m.17260 type:complete len:359 (+) Transcript_6700:407-1483(+)
MEGPRIEAVHPPRFAPDDRDGILAYLDEHGYVVVGAALAPHAVTTGKTLFWDFLERGDVDGRHPGDPSAGDDRLRLSRADPTTWDDERWAARVSAPTVGLINHGGMGHSEFAWHLRTQPRVQEAFAAVWGTAKLLTSFDGGNAFRPWSGPGGHAEWKTHGGWFHVDQAPSKRDRCCVQGLVPFTDATEYTGGLVVIPGSHRDFASMADRNHRLARGDFISVPKEDPILHSGPAMLVCADAGDLIMWDSRTVHCNTPGLSPLPPPDLKAAELEEPVQLLRIVGYVCMTPVAWAPAEVLESRRQAFKTKTGTSHWPHQFVSCMDGLVNFEHRADAIKTAPPEIRSLVDGRSGGRGACLIV